MFWLLVGYVVDCFDGCFVLAGIVGGCWFVVGF